MSTIGQHISNLRGLIVKYSRTQENYTDQFLYQLLNGARTRRINSVAKNLDQLSEWLWQTFTIEMEQSDPPNWECVPSYLKGNCKVIKSIYKIPPAIKGLNKTMMSFSTLGGKGIDLYTEDEQTIYKDDKIRSKFIMGSIVNGYLYIWNNPDLKFVKVNAIWQDPTDWALIPDCTGELDTCYSIADSYYPLDEEDKDLVYDMAIQKLAIPLKLQQDQTNDSNESIKG